MKKQIRQRRCKNCQNLFKPDPRHLKRQRFCDKPECKIASKKHSQQKWLNKPKNRDYFSGPENVARVQEWRQGNPGYWKRKKPPETPSLTEDALQGLCCKKCAFYKKNTWQFLCKNLTEHHWVNV